MKKKFLLPAIALAGVVCMLASLPAHAAGLKCTGADGKSACTATQLTDLNTALASGKRMHKPFLIDIQSFSWGASNTIVCKQTGGGDCDDTHIKAVVSLASTLKSSGGAMHLAVVAPREASSGMATGR